MSDSDVESNFDPYKALGGLPRTASAAEINKAYIRVARENHPDTHKGDAACAKRFKDANRAKTMLLDPKKRAEYDGLAATIRNTVTQAARNNPRANDILNRVNRGIPGTRTPGTVPERPRRTPSSDRIPTPPERAAPSDVNRTTSRQSPLEDRAARNREAAEAAERETLRPQAPAGAPDTNDAPTLRAWTQKAAEAIRRATDGDIRDRDRLYLPNGSIYSYRRVLFKKPNAEGKFRTSIPLLCRGNEVLANVQLIPGQGLKLATAATCQQFINDVDLLEQAAVALVSQRDLAAPMARELASIMADDETLQFNQLAFQPRDITFETKAGIVVERVLCAGSEVLELRAGDIAETGVRFADAATTRALTANYQALWSIAAAQARDKGRSVSIMTGRHAGNSLRAVASRWGVGL